MQAFERCGSKASVSSSELVLSRDRRAHHIRCKYDFEFLRKDSSYGSDSKGTKSRDVTWLSCDNELNHRPRLGAVQETPVCALVLLAQLAYEMQTSKADSFMANMKPCAQSPLFGELPPSCFLIASMTNFSFLVSSTVVKDLVLRAYAFLHLNKETKAIQLK